MPATGAATLRTDSARKAITADDVKAVRDNLARARLEGRLSGKRCLNVWSRVIKAPFSRAWHDDDPRYGELRIGPYAANLALGIKPPVSRDDADEDERERQPLEPGEALALLACRDATSRTAATSPSRATPV